MPILKPAKKYNYVFGIRENIFFNVLQVKHKVLKWKKFLNH